MNTEEADQIKRCMLCGEPIEGGRVTAYKADGSVAHVWCRKCDTLERVLEYQRTRRITSWLATEVQVAAASAKYNTPMPASYQPIQQDLELVYAAIKTFSPHWPKVVACSEAELTARGLSQKISDSVKIMSWTMCGRIMVTIDSKEHSVTIMGNDHLSDEEDAFNGCFFRGIDATAEAAVSLLERAATWAADGKLDLKVDKNVSYCGL